MTHALTTLTQLGKEHAGDIATWFDKAYLNQRTPIYSSVDIRDAGFKIAPVDTNLFPAGFNNLNEAAQEKAVTEMTHNFERYARRSGKAVRRVLLMSENHTRNRPYFDNIAMIRSICERAGAEVVIGRFDLEAGQTIDTETTDDRIITAESITLDGVTLKTGSGFVPDVVIVNNDLSSGCPEILCDAQQPIFPPAGMGWYRRRKSVHFEAYNQIANEFSAHFKIDPWLISTVIHHCGKINFKERKGMECVAIGIDKAIHRIKQKYEEYGIKDEPYVYIKADSGTYGMGIMTARSGDEMLELNKKTRNKMNVIKEGVSNSEVIIQEGVPTITRRGNAVAEPMLYLVGAKPVGHIWRVNESRDATSSLNAQGMHFEPFEAGADVTAYDIIAQLATLASVYEHYDTNACGDEL